MMRVSTSIGPREHFGGFRVTVFELPSQCDTLVGDATTCAIRAPL